MGSWEENIRRVEPYVPGEQPSDKNIIKLNTNENPYGPSPRVKAINLDTDLLKKYPDPKAELLVSTLAAYHGLDESQVFVGVGSDDVIAMSFMTFFNSKKPILFPDITYSFYDVWADMLRIPYEKQPLDDNFNIVKEDYLNKENGGIIFPNPNAPTGILVDLAFIEDIVKANPDSVVIIDEAYIDFGGESALPLIDKYENLLVVRTFSKSRSMAGLRIGYAMGSPKLIKYLNDVKYSFNSYTMNMPSIILGSEVIADDEYFRECTGKIIETREWFSDKLKTLGFKVLPSKANFVFASPDKVSAEEVFKTARENGIYFRFFNAPRISSFLRITIGTREEMEKVVSFLEGIL
ncbi:MAG TPA: histidinol-phosphate transaminase [Lachnospiraceae bacterium]|nr:histidinol-phosphate transaminase [Lachnospiraceae bacterium]